jgi:hypothetical protein
MSGLRLCGHLLLWIGFLAGAFISVRNIEVVNDPWATISWLEYCSALALSGVGVVVLRKTQRAARMGKAAEAGAVDRLEELLKKLLNELQRWQTDEGRLAVHDVHGEIDNRLGDDLAEFSELRESLVDAFGLQHFASIMTEFALAERTINRMWSASADGYVDEIELCLTRASAHLENAIDKLQVARDTTGAAESAV